jgi:hypothetical protein
MMPTVVTLAIGLLIWTPAAQSRVRKIIIDTTTSPAAPAGAVGAYETLAGRAFGDIDPRDPLHAIIQDVALAPKNSGGRVEYMTTFLLTKPIDMSKSSGLMWHDAPLRGTRINTAIGTPYAERDFGDVLLSSGWQGDNAGQTAQVFPNNGDYVVVPVATNLDGTPITGRVMGRIVNRWGPNSQIVPVQTNPVPYQPVTLDTKQSILTTHAHEAIDGVLSGVSTISSSDWAWAACDVTHPFPGTPDPTQICLKNGFDPALIYQVEFTAKNPYVLGIGFAAFRDVASFFKNEVQDDFGTANPVVGSIRWIISRGESQCANFLRQFLHLGFNQDESGRQVFDGLWPFAGGRRITMNFRWAMPDAGRELYQAGEEGPQWWEDYADNVRGLPWGGMLDRCRASNTCPKIMEHYGSPEMWFLRLSFGWVGTDSADDIAVPDNVRRYYIPSSPHLGGSGGFNSSLTGVGLATTGAACAGNNYGFGILPANPVPHTQTVNALRVHFRDWVMNGTPPPANRYPTLRDGNLVEATKEAMGFPSIPGLPEWAPTGLINPLLDYDWGPNFNYSDGSGVPSSGPPQIRQVIPLLVPRVDADGNERGGVPVVLRDAPLGTYLGWNITAGGALPFHQDQICSYTGGMIPFARTKAERLANGDARLSLEERYVDHAGYVAAVQRAADNAVAQGFLLDADAKVLVANAEASNVLK